jgi:hypothetical protein
MNEKEKESGGSAGSGGDSPKSVGGSEYQAPQDVVIANFFLNLISTTRPTKGKSLEIGDYEWRDLEWCQQPLERSCGCAKSGW